MALAKLGHEREIIIVTVGLEYLHNAGVVDLPEDYQFVDGYLGPFFSVLQVCEGVFKRVYFHDLDGPC